ncbi:wax ester/triacylglycerol synthase domain-containing protein [Pseudonocardia sp. WMMC193]|uniref:wax ester/triacylglycerol synthase domain-containing protein n=1 Tax=Pseudonocardia sp. WMMC193 TaxID=2911965 RepID=UPI001EFF95C6|nr:wax ester/triacylglycerol synthase domain-containing protein [Pseudonocardia sp. WMMC193]MCF7548625.1 WS/DGAT domain-containing protein [Pseudonocardia sp. WMMC193]
MIVPTAAAWAARRAPVPERAGPDDLRESAVDRAGVPWQFGVLLVLDRPLDPAEVRRVLAVRIRAVPRLRRRLVRTPPLCGRPVWVDDPGFAIERHVREVRCAGPLTDDVLRDVAVRAVGTRLSWQRSPWEALVVTGTTGDRGALVVVCHHVLADGMGGLAALAALVDDGLAVGDPPAHDDGFPRPAPTVAQLVVDALATRARTLRDLPGEVRRIREALGELRATQAPRPPRSSLNRPVGARRALRVVRVDLGAVHAAAHRHGGTVNDVLLTAIGGALGELLRGRGDQVDEVVAAVSITARPRADATLLGNAVGVLPVGLPTSGPPAARLREVARRTATGRRRARGASAAVLGPMIRLAAAVGVLRCIVDHQRSVTTFVTNLRGPRAPLTLLGARIGEIVPITTTTGNVPVVFGALSYAGTLAVTVVADPDVCPELDALVAALRADLVALLAAPGVPDHRAGDPGR